MLRALRPVFFCAGRLVASDSNGNGGGITFPKWFLYVMAGFWAVFVATFVPWAAWVSIALISMQVRSERQAENTRQIEEVKSDLFEHIGDRLLHSGEDVLRRLDKLENKAGVQ